MDKLDILRPILNNKYGPGAKFLANYFLEVDKISKKVLLEGYQQKYLEFKKICDDFKASIKSDSFESSNKHETSPVQKKKNNDAALVEKFRTPMAKKSNGPLFNKQSVIIDIASGDDEQQQQNLKKTKKRSALMAEISVLADENSCVEDEETEEDIKKPLFKDENTNTKKSSKSAKTSKKNDNKKQSKDAITNNENEDQDNSYEQVVTAKPEGKKGKNPSKKLKIVNTDTENAGDTEPVPVISKKTTKEEAAIATEEETGEETTKTKKSKKKKNKISEIESATGPTIVKPTTSKKEKATKKSKKTKQTSDVGGGEKTLEPEPRALQLQNDPKTPVASKDSLKRKSRLELLQSTVKKTIKKRPLTRRAAAQAAQAAAAATTTTAASAKVETTVSSIKAPNTLKKVNKFESGIPKPSQVISNDSSKTPLVHRNKEINNILLTASKIKPNFRTSIDERKVRTSQAKLEAKRKSVKKAQAILKSIQNERKSMLSNNNNLILEDDDNDETVEETKNPLSREKEKELKDNIHKSGSPKIVLHKIPITNSTNISASKAASIVENQRRLTKDLLASNTIQQNYRVQQPQFLNKMTTPGKNVPPGAGRSSFIKFLERNTPSKLTMKENEEKQKAERAAKEAKEKERLQAIEKQKLEKLDAQKKLREEKMKKINEAKIKQEQEQEKKKLAIQQEQIQPSNIVQKSKMPLTSNSCMNLNQVKSTTTASTSNAATNLSASTSNLTTIVKKQPTIQVLKPIYDQNDLSTFGNDFNTFKQINNQLKQGSMDTYNHNQNHQHHQQKNLCETTYVLNSPDKLKPSSYSKQQENLAKPVFTNYEVTPLQPPKLKNQDNYDVSGLGSEDDTDDEDDPSKPIPEWARDPHLIRKVQLQAKSMYNFTKVFKAASQSEIILENIFKTRRKKFTERSSSANWDSTPIWKSNGISGEESFWQFKKNY